MKIVHLTTSKFFFCVLLYFYYISNKESIIYILQVGPLSDYTIKFLQHLKDFFGVMFKLEVLRVEDDNEGSSDEEDTTPSAQRIKMTCIGIGYVNISKRTL